LAHDVIIACLRLGQPDGKHLLKATDGHGFTLIKILPSVFISVHLWFHPLETHQDDDVVYNHGMH